MHVSFFTVSRGLERDLRVTSIGFSKEIVLERIRERGGLCRREEKGAT